MSKLHCTRHQQHCYSLVLNTATFTDAEITCAGYGGILATIPDEGTQLFIIQLVGDRDTWIGLDDRRNEGQFMWSDGTPLGSGYTYWSPGEPNDASTSSDQDCVHLWPLAGFRWDDQPCERMEHFVCQFSASGDRSNADPGNSNVPGNSHDRHLDHQAQQ
ncbi:C-type lectin mannose-binding isoform-like [Branchiostoma floridae]|uniref:C-type lectin mannose-binding isoform-like n=1 Tax=Branchiostoma floridae TaxID=7739 RepID=A0A9J7KHD9_BRAFL|nr:C-type lectin mannose-binding isoform-like [Branchiostoma floridae]